MNDSRPTICQFVHSMSVGGAELLALAYATNSAAKFKSVFACLDSIGSVGETLVQENEIIRAFDRKPGFDRLLIKRLRQFWNERAVDIVHAQQYTPFFYAAISRMGGRRPPILFTEHGRAHPDFRRPKRVLANRFLLRKNDRVVAVGQNVKEALINNEGIADERIEVIYNGIETAKYKLDPQLRIGVRESLELSPDSVAVFCIARLNALKDHATAIRAWTHLSELPAAKLFLVGDGEERFAIESQIATYGLQERVTLLGSRNDVPTLLNAADICLLSSVSEGIPLTLIEAMATSVPCVATDVGGIPEVIVDGETGFMSPAGNDRAIASHVRKLAMDRQLRSYMSEQSRMRAVEYFDSCDMHRRYQELYEDMLIETPKSA